MSGLKMRQGQNRHTAYKLEMLGKTLGQNIAITKAPSMRGNPYFHFDLNAGSGWNELVNRPGSPLIVRNVAESHERHVKAWFVEQDPSLCRELEQRLAEVPCKYLEYEVICADNLEFCKEIKRILAGVKIRRRELRGSFLCDPNGIQVPWEGLQPLFDRYEGIDPVLILSAKTILRVRPAMPDKYGWMFLKDIPVYMHRRYVWVCKPDSGDQWDRVVFIGRNWEPRRPVRDFFKIGTPEADAIIDKLNTSQVEKKRAELALSHTEHTRNTSGIRHFAKSAH